MEQAQVHQQVGQMQEVFAPHMDHVSTVYRGSTATAIAICLLWSANCSCVHPTRLNSSPEW